MNTPKQIGAFACERGGSIQIAFQVGRDGLVVERIADCPLAAELAEEGKAKRVVLPDPRTIAFIAGDVALAQQRDSHAFEIAELAV